MSAQLEIPAGRQDEGSDHTLAKAVRAALEQYFAQLGGHEPDDLYRMVIEEVERPLLECVMRHSGGNQTRAAQYLGLNRGTLRKKLRQYDIE